MNWECTVAGSLLVDESERFEIMPWPRRIFMRSYPAVNLMTLPFAPMLDSYLAHLTAEGNTELLADTRRVFQLFLDFYQEYGEESRKETLGFADLADRTAEMRFGDVWGAVRGFYKHLASWEDQEDAQKMRSAIARFYHNPTDQRVSIPQAYATELQIVYNALCDMHWPDDTEWLYGQSGTGLAISDTLMYQRGDPEPSDADMSSVYGLAMPLVKHGVALTMVQLERVVDPGYLDNVSVLLLTYEGQKPPSPEIHIALAEWLRNKHSGGPNILLLFGTGDVYNGVREWWNQGGMNYERPQDHLTELLDLGRMPESGTYACGEGWLVFAPDSPAALAHDKLGATIVLDLVKQAHEKLGVAWTQRNVLALRRGPYVVAAGMDESTSETTTVLPGTFINLFDATLAVVKNPGIAPDTRWLLYDLARCPDYPWVIAAAGRVLDEVYDDNTLSFTIEGMAGTTCIVRAWVPNAPTTVVAQDRDVAILWDADSSTASVSFANDPAGVSVRIKW